MKINLFSIKRFKKVNQKIHRVDNEKVDYKIEKVKFNEKVDIN